MVAKIKQLEGTVAKFKSTTQNLNEERDRLKRKVRRTLFFCEVVHCSDVYCRFESCRRNLAHPPVISPTVTALAAFDGLTVVRYQRLVLHRRPAVLHHRLLQIIIVASLYPLHRN